MSDKHEVYKSIVAITGELATQGISKDNTNKQQGFKYRGIDQVYGALSPLLAKHNLCILPRIESKEVVERTSSNGNALFYTTVEAQFDVVSAVDGSCHTVASFGEAMDSGDKSIGKAMSYAYKAMAFMLFAIPTEGDNDPDAKTHEVQPKKTAAPTTGTTETLAINKTLLEELGTYCAGDLEKMDTLLKRISHYEADGKEYSFGLDRLPKTSEKWATKVLATLRKHVAAEATANVEICSECHTPLVNGRCPSCPF